MLLSKYIMLTVTCSHKIHSVVYRQDSTTKLLDAGCSFAHDCSSSYLLQGYQVAINMTRTQLNVEILERAPTPLFGRLVMYSAYKCSFYNISVIISQDAK